MDIRLLLLRSSEAVVYFPAYLSLNQAWRMHLIVSCIHVLIIDVLLSIEEADVGDSGGNGGKTEPISECEKYTEVDPAMLIVSIQIKLKLVVHDGCDIIARAVGHEQV
uniref:Uncharacterized protein n=1 Tax=Oryza brachyantha TaxID=4533 RepID=J3LG32_ORYBR